MPKPNCVGKDVSDCVASSCPTVNVTINIKELAVPSIGAALHQAATRRTHRRLESLVGRHEIKLYTAHQVWPRQESDKCDR